jgi:two-component system phosphate regulon sensor histidine kinase PhoR
MEFLADVSHELKTPLFTAQGFIHTLLDGAISDKNVKSRFLKKAAKCLSRLDKLVQDLLAISQMESVNITMHYSHFNIYNLIQEALDQLEGKAEKKSLKLCFNKSCPKDIYVNADKQKIFQVMLNLILNAINYTREAGSEITVDLKEEEKSRAKDRGGIGFGLAIVKHILEAHNQKIYVESKVSDGSVFSFNLEKGIKEEGIVDDFHDR